MKEQFYVIGIDIGGSSVKGALVRTDGIGRHTLVCKVHEKLFRRNPVDVAHIVMEKLLATASLLRRDIAYVATTGEGEHFPDKDGHFYSMTCHARGALFLEPRARTVVDLGAFYVRVMKVDSRGMVTAYRMTSQCASGSGQFIENIARYMGYAVEEVGEISLQATNPQMPSGICAVLSETDVINFISRRVPPADILMGINMSVAGRVVRLASTLGVESPVFLSGGLALNRGFVHALKQEFKQKLPDLEIVTHPDAIYTGAIGAALWGALRHVFLRKTRQHGGVAVQ